VTRTPAGRGTRALVAAQLLTGALEAFRPDGVVAVLAPGSGRPPRWVVRLLGVRRLVQGTLTGVRPRPTVLLLGAAVDTLHALSMLAVPLRWPRHQRAAMLSAAGAAGFAALAGLLARRR
jgi:hypothetical protein